MQKKNHGFSMVELIIVIAVMAVLAAALAPQLIKYVKKSKRTRDVDSVNEICKAYERAAIPARDNSDGGTEVGTGTSLLRYDTTFHSPSQTLEDYVYEELGSIPKVAAYSDYYWYIEYDKATAHVTKVEITSGGNSATSYEIYPDTESYLNGNVN
jgi:type IV pilus assembly protein PilA